MPPQGRWPEDLSLSEKSAGVHGRSVTSTALGSLRVNLEMPPYLWRVSKPLGWALSRATVLCMAVLEPWPSGRHMLVHTSAFTPAARDTPCFPAFRPLQAPRTRPAPAEQALTPSCKVSTMAPGSSQPPWLSPPELPPALRLSVTSLPSAWSHDLQEVCVVPHAGPRM